MYMQYYTKITIYLLLAHSHVNDTFYLFSGVGLLDFINAT